MNISLQDISVRAYRWFKRPKVTFTIILILLVLFSLGLIIPQKVFFSTKAEYTEWQDLHPVLYSFLDFIGFTEIYTSPVTLIFLTLFYLNLLTVVADRTPSVLRRAYLLDPGRTLEVSADELKLSDRCRRIELSSPRREGVAQMIREYFRKHLWYVREYEPSGGLIAVKNRFSALGFLLFHLSFLLCLTGGLTIYYTRFSGQIALTEGQSFQGDIKQFYRIDKEPKTMRKLSSLALEVKKVEMVYKADRKSALNVLMKIVYDGQVKEELIGINRPVRRGSYSLLVVNANISPLFRIRDVNDGKILDGAWVSLNVLGGGEDSFEMDGDSQIEYHAKFFPDYIKKDGIEKTRSHEIRNPAFHVTVKDGGKVIADATIKKGQAIVYGSVMLEFAELRYWADIKVVREMGPVPLVAGFFLAIVGLMMRLIFYRKEIRIAIDENRIYLVGKSDFHQHAFEEEMGGIEERLRASLVDGSK